jgi:hypothetical protein
MFGYKLKLVKNSDLLEVDMMKKALSGIDNIIEEFGDFIAAGMDLNQATIKKITEMNDDLGVYVDIYFNNKFSLPSNALMMYSNMDTIRSNSLIIIDTITEYYKLQSVKEKYEHEVENGILSYSEQNAISSEMSKGFNKINNNLGMASANIINGLLLLSAAIRGDKTRVTMGVDIIKDYKHRQKMRKQNEKLDGSFTIEYKLTSRSDKEYLLKERVKNDKQRSRARTSNGGSEKTV